MLINTESFSPSPTAVDQSKAGYRPCGLYPVHRNNNRQSQQLKKIPVFDNCCGDHYYNPKYQLCCRRNILLKPSPDHFCCGSTKTFNYKTQLCCGSVVKSKTASQNACCRNVAYDSSKHICCGGKLTPRVSSVQHLNRCCG